MTTLTKEVAELVKRAFEHGFCDGWYMDKEKQVDVMIKFDDWVKDGMPEVSENA